ncbi:hypothetical protein [Nocardia wallacei]|uniref:hypothetical protein n=1 Tax=Nocardia wallacei TaxID=480035 RepID=UPI0024584EDB|nr:hypothetical protein [Nocardia wallacei]
MPAHKRRQRSDARITNGNTEARSGEQSDTIVPLHRSKKRPGVDIERIETEQMTTDEYNHAVATFATLINEWESRTSTLSRGGEMAA